MKLIKSEKYHNVFSYKAKKGTLYAFRYLYYDLLGNRHEKQQRGFMSELDAHKAELRVEIEAADNEAPQIANSNTTVSDWASMYYKLRHAKWSPSYCTSFSICVRKYISPMIGKFKLNELTKIRYDYQFIQPQMEMNLSPSTIRANHNKVMALFNAAVDNDFIPRNRLRGLHLPAARKRHAFTQADLDKFNQQIKQLGLGEHAYFLTLELTGMRKGEGLALQWKDIDFKHSKLSISKSRNEYGLGPTKTPASVRTISLAKDLVKFLKHYRTQKRAQFLAIGKPFSQDDFVFTTQGQRPLSWNTINLNFHQAIDGAGIEPGQYVIHSLRHTHATLLINSGASPIDVAKRLGHADASTTLSIYTHPVEGNDTNNAELFAKIINF